MALEEVGRPQVATTLTAVTRLNTTTEDGREETPPRCALTVVLATSNRRTCGTAHGLPKVEQPDRFRYDATWSIHRKSGILRGCMRARATPQRFRARHSTISTLIAQRTTRSGSAA